MLILSTGFFSRCSNFDILSECSLQKHLFSLLNLIQNKKHRLAFARRCFCFVYQIITFAAKPPQKKKVFIQYCSGGGEGSRTPVRKPVHTNFSGCRMLFKIPESGGQHSNCPFRYFPVTAAVRKKLPPVVHRWSTPLPKPRYSPAGRLLN